MESISKHYIASKLEWDIHGVFDKIWDLKRILELERTNIPDNHTKNLDKLTRWITQLTDIEKNLEYIEETLIGKIKKAFKYQFESVELLKLIFFRPSIKNLFKELQTHFSTNQKILISIDFDTFMNLGDAAEVLALIGDAAISLAAAQIFWESKISNVGNISSQRQTLVSNENLSKTCDRLNLYNHRIHRDPSNQPVKDETIHHIKGTLVEAIYGIIYTEQGMDAVFNALVAIK